MACVRITSGGRTWIQHDDDCPGRFNIFLCLFWITEDAERREEAERHHHRRPDDDDPYCEPDADHVHWHERRHHKHEHHRHER